MAFELIWKSAQSVTKCVVCIRACVGSNLAEFGPTNPGKILIHTYVSSTRFDPVSVIPANVSSWTDCCRLSNLQYVNDLHIPHKKSFFLSHQDSSTLTRYMLGIQKQSDKQIFFRNKKTIREFHRHENRSIFLVVELVGPVTFCAHRTRLPDPIGSRLVNADWFQFGLHNWQLKDNVGPTAHICFP